MKIYTRTGDQGETGLFGGERVSKDHPRIHAYGTVDETNSVIGLARSFLEGPGTEKVDELLHRVQQDLFVVGADLATPLGAKPAVPRVTGEHVAFLETQIDDFDKALPSLKYFVLPGGTSAASALHVARTVCRRAERSTVALARTEAVDEQLVVYLNRLSDLLFVIARWINQNAGIEDVAWEN